MKNLNFTFSRCIDLSISRFSLSLSSSLQSPDHQRNSFDPGPENYVLHNRIFCSFSTISFHQCCCLLSFSFSKKTKFEISLRHDDLGDFPTNDKYNEH